MIATFSPPMSAQTIVKTTKKPDQFINVIVIAVTDRDPRGAEANDVPVFICVGPDGILRYLAPDKLIFDFRYDTEKGRWVDTSVPEDEGTEDTTEDTTSGDL